ncbi:MULTISPECIES: glycoside hydrolase [unclassified Pseudomonas]|uniref:glycoside hydrolase n=1 Tax=unclassified Pseudomonas TaxID=196821 RepID=UPI0025D47DA1|nr:MULTISPECIES: glycoside hydrolase [unclassified Pseudomonas]
MSGFLLRAVCWLCAFVCGPASAGEALDNAIWRVDVDPSTLAIRVQPAGQMWVDVSTGVATHPVSQFKRTSNRLTWQWNEGAWSLEAHLDQRELLLTLRAREAGVLDILNQPADAMGRALIWPPAEGHYVPRGDAVWQRFLVGQGELNTTQDLSLPLWGMHHGTFSLTWMMTHPFNNRLVLKAEGDALAISARHEFTSLDPHAPLTFRLYLGDPDPLAGARHYRQWLIDTGAYLPLEEKFAATPEARKLLGATHLYLWGNDLLGPDDVRSWPRLLKVLASPAPLAGRLSKLMDAEASAILQRKSAPVQRWEQIRVLRGLNQAFNSVARDQWRSESRPNMRRLAGSYGELRAQVAQLFGAALTDDPSTWGGMLSAKNIDAMRAAGLTHLWLGLGEGWEGGLWHPEAVRAAVQAGYLIAPYDSYETALSDNENPDWTTAHLGSDAHRDCGIVLKDGRPRSGFQQSGRYTDPRCVRPLLEARVQAIHEVAGFNSWFLDAYATGMVFDSYRPGASLTQAQNAEANVDGARWIAESQGLTVGSEDGNASTSQGILFAHGMQTPVIGWGDPDLARNRTSPWYLGSWYPPEQPAVFFKPVPIKEPYRRVHFDPTTRLPLYQTVFHGSVITTHHWLFDSLKLSNVQIENELTQLLYNVPPLYHVSRETLSRRLKAIQRQDAFFRPLHERLGTQAMTGFQWLTHDKRVQQTTFADGTRLVANFDGTARDVGGQAFGPHSVTAIGLDATVVTYQVLRQTLANQGCCSLGKPSGR